MLDGRPWRFTGVNEYWLGLDDNISDAQGPTYPSHTAIDNGLRAAKQLGARVVRATTLGVSVGSPRTLEPSLGTFNDTAFDSIDYAVARARHYGLRLMIPLTDEGHYYHGGKHTFTNWRGFTDLSGQTSTTNSEQRQLEAHFYTDPQVIGDFHNYIAHLLNHVNPLTGLRLGSDPTIAIWETGNEVFDAPVSWTEQTAAYIKTLAPHALVADGSASTGKNITETAVNEPDVDIIDAHFYPINTSQATTDAAYATAHHKVYVIGEYPLNGPTTDTTDWLTHIATDHNITGDLAWTLLPYLPNGTPEPHGEAYTFHYPGATPHRDHLGHLAEATRHGDGRWMIFDDNALREHRNGYGRR